MKKKMKLLSILIFLLFGMSIPLKAKKGYVTDAFEITLRIEGHKRSKVIAMPKSGSPLIILSKNGDWTQVKMLEGSKKTGWVMDRFIVKHPPYRQQYIVLEETYKKTKGTLETLKLEMSKLKDTIQDLEQKIHMANSDLKQKQTAFEDLKMGSTQFLALKDDYENALSELAMVKTSVDILQKENLLLKNDDKKRWFMIGAIVVAIGFLSGLVLGQKNKKTRY